MDGAWGEPAFDYLPVPTERRSQILHPFAIPCMQGVLALNVTRGCAHACVYCYARAYPEAPPRGQLLVYENLPVDPFGFAGVPMRLIARIVENPRCECLVTFAYESINRFLAHSDPEIQAHFDELFGTTEWRKVAKERDPSKRRGQIVALYRRQLMQVAYLPFVRTFEMINEGNRTEYFLYFGTKNPKGFSKMKESMWRADPVAGRVFSDLTDARQEVLLEAEADLTRLRNLLQHRFRGRGAVAIEEVEEFVLKETPYSESIHLKRRTLAPMEEEKLIAVQAKPGRNCRRGTYPPGTRLTFL